MSYEGKNFPSGTIGCDALNIPAALIKQITELCGSLNLFMGAMQLGMANAELFISARESALQIVHKLKDIPPFSYLDEKRITAHIQKIFSNEYLENAMTYAKSLASGNLMNALDPQYQKALTLLRVVPVLAHDFFEGLFVGHAPKKCPICRRWFLTTNARHTKYCGNLAPGISSIELAARLETCKEGHNVNLLMTILSSRFMNAAVTPLTGMSSVELSMLTLPNI